MHGEVQECVRGFGEKARRKETTTNHLDAGGRIILTKSSGKN
jgi:hypothetical protein